MKKSGQCRTTADKNHRHFDHPRDGTPKIAEEFQERIGLLFFNLVGPILGQPFLRLGLSEAVRRQAQFFLHLRKGRDFKSSASTFEFTFGSGAFWSETVFIFLDFFGFCHVVVFAK